MELFSRSWGFNQFRKALYEYSCSAVSLTGSGARAAGAISLFGAGGLFNAGAKVSGV